MSYHTAENCRLSMQWACWVLGPVLSPGGTLRKKVWSLEELTVYWRKQTNSQKITIQHSNATTDTDTQRRQWEHTGDP